MRSGTWIVLFGLFAVTGCNGGRGGGSGNSVDADQALRAGVVWGSCVPDDGIEDFLVDLHLKDAHLDPAQVRCIADAGGGCGALESCVGITVDLGGPCEETCAGDVTTSCDDELRFRMDCAALGRECVPGRGCEEPDVGDPCDWETFEGYCDAGQPVFCGDDTTWRGPVCADLGLVCGAGPNGTGAVCRGDVADCETDSWGSSIPWRGTACHGDTLEICVNGGLHLEDCAERHPGMGCQTATDDEGQVVAFCGFGSDCLPDKEDVECEGNSVVVCDMGRREVVDCTALGFTGCAAPLGCTPTGWRP